MPEGMIVVSVITIIAIVVGPIAALFIQSKLNERKENRARKLQILRTMMAHRRTRLSIAFVEAVNAIEMEFYTEEGKYKKVIEAWREYCEYLYRPDATDPLKVEAWEEKSVELLHRLLCEMAESSGYHFESGVLKRSLYYPRGWNEAELESLQLRKASLKVFSGENPLKMEVAKPIKVVQIVEAQGDSQDHT